MLQNKRRVIESSFLFPDEDSGIDNKEEPGGTLNARAYVEEGAVAPADADDDVLGLDFAVEQLAGYVAWREGDIHVHFL